MQLSGSCMLGISSNNEFGWLRVRGLGHTACSLGQGLWEECFLDQGMDDTAPDRIGLGLGHHLGATYTQSLKRCNITKGASVCYFLLLMLNP